MFYIYVLLILFPFSRVHSIYKSIKIMINIYILRIIVVIIFHTVAHVLTKFKIFIFLNNFNIFKQKIIINKRKSQIN